MGIINGKFQLKMVQLDGADQKQVTTFQCLR